MDGSPAYEAYVYKALADVPSSGSCLDLIRARFCLDLSILAYTRPGFIEAELRDIGKVARFEAQDVAAFILDLPTGETFFVARGTEIHAGAEATVRDLLLDADGIMIREDPGLSPAVHRGFRNALDDLGWKQIAASLQGKRVWFTGHSLGAAISTIAMFRAHKSSIRVLGAYTFGSPRVGNKEFGWCLGNYPLYRYVHGTDIVPRLPPAGMYQHVGLEVHLDDDGFPGVHPVLKISAWVKAVIAKHIGFVVGLEDHNPITGYSLALARK